MRVPGRNTYFQGQIISAEACTIEQNTIFVIDDVEGVIEEVLSAEIERSFQESATDDGTHPVDCFQRLHHHCTDH